MTGLEADRHVIVEIATLVTDDDLAVVAEGPDLVVPRHRGAAGAPWTTSSGTCTPRAACSRRSGPRTLTLEEAGRQTLEFIRAHVPKARTVPAGRQLDRHRPPVPGRPPPRDRGVPPLPLGRRLHRQGAGRAAGTPRPLAGAPRPRPAATGPWTTSGSPWPSWPTTGPPSSRTPPPEAVAAATRATPEREEHPWPTSTDRPDPPEDGTPATTCPPGPRSPPP